jgi:hypothetical protein
MTNTELARIERREMFERHMADFERRAALVLSTAPDIPAEMNQGAWLVVHRSGSGERRTWHDTQPSAPYLSRGK